MDALYTSIKCSEFVGLKSVSKMFSKVVICLAFLAVAFAERPRVGLQMPPILHQLHSPQVVGGEEAPAGRYPFIVSLQFLGLHFCAGSILSTHWIVTAGHCVQAIPFPRLITVKAGKHNIGTSEADEQSVRVRRGIVHQDFKGDVGPYDIALLELASPLKITKRVQPIDLPTPESEPTGEAWLSGWGSISSSLFPEMPDKLQHVKMEYIDRATCYQAVLNLTGDSPVHETNICTGPLHETISACSGDSGGPLISRNGEEAVLTGIVSWGIMPCGSDGAPSVYTKVSKFNRWIEDNINDGQR